MFAGILSEILPGMCSGILSCIFSGILSAVLFWQPIVAFYLASILTFSPHGHCRASNASARSQWPGSWGRAATDLGSSRLSSIPAELRSLQLPKEEEKKEEKEATLTESSDPHVAGYQKSIVQRGQCWSHWNTLLLPAQIKYSGVGMPKMNFCIRFQLGNLFGSTKRIGSQLGFLVGNAKWKQVELMYLISSGQSARQCYMKQVELTFIVWRC